MRIIALLLTFTLSSACISAAGCSDPKPDYSEFYKPDPSDGPEEPINPGLEDNQLKVISFNVRYSSADDGSNNWDNRKKAFPAMFADQLPTVLGVQEARLDQKTYMDENCEGYRSVGVGRTDGKNAGEFMAIYYLADAVKLEKWGTFWLSETPDTPSIGWDASVQRTATWAVFTHYVSGERFFFINTHLDHQGVIAPGKSMELIEARIKALNTDNLPVMMTGDFNKMIDSEIFNGVKKFMSDVRTSAPVTDNKASYNAFGGSTSYPRIDHIFSSGVTPVRFATIDQRYEKVPYISDHYPIAAVLEFK
ncbi:endonuclease/exonuclease/phosphatase family protein [uncultured Alistipes sp.]|jgi:metal-dependent hydrolase|uniref:endonuclease/exonuclease/phosphatase family protein n=1 Tax=uncultured Alistipes sp. TaxID=538949 RepID=UPI0025E08486|nr:endonuclease/exonuclease/phosphatase family protein [uncultured Alistipes sp.]